jgi:hypothetical protein
VDALLQLAEIGLLSPLHAINGSIEALGCVAGPLLGFGSEWHGIKGKGLTDPQNVGRWP